MPFHQRQQLLDEDNFSSLAWTFFFRDRKAERDFSTKRSSLVVSFEHETKQKSDEHKHLIETQGTVGDDCGAVKGVEESFIFSIKPFGVSCRWASWLGRLKQMLKAYSRLRTVEFQYPSSIRKQSGIKGKHEARFITSFNIIDEIL